MPVTCSWSVGACLRHDRYLWDSYAAVILSVGVSSRWHHRRLWDGDAGVILAVDGTLMPVVSILMCGAVGRTMITVS